MMTISFMYLKKKKKKKKRYNLHIRTFYPKIVFYLQIHETDSHEADMRGDLFTLCFISFYSPVFEHFSDLRKSVF